MQLRWGTCFGYPETINPFRNYLYHRRKICGKVVKDYTQEDDDMTPDAYKVMVMAVETGVALGVRRAFKHDAKPSDEAIIAAVERAVIDELCEWFKFEEVKP